MSKEVTSKIRPATSYTTTKYDEGVRIRMGNEGPAAVDPVTLPHILYRTTKNYPDVAALKYKDEDNVWQTVTYSQYRENVLKTAKTFIKLGLEPRKTVAILAFNCPEWFYSELGAIHAGYVTLTSNFI